MKRYEPAWIFNFILKIAVAIFLGMLAISLAVGVTPFTALLRSGAGFSVFAMLGWAAALTWELPEKEEAPKEKVEDLSEADEAQPESAANGTNGTTSSSEQFTPFVPSSINNAGGTAQPQAAAANSPVQQLEAVP
jgi:hypothetical protein